MGKTKGVSYHSCFMELSQTSLSERLPAYMAPRKFHFLDAFPMTANGKADRRKLAEVLGAK